MDRVNNMTRRLALKLYYFLALIVLLPGCASKLPVAIKEPPPGNPHLAEVRQDAGRFKGTFVRWGGVIAKIENKKEQTWIEIVSRELRKNGEPIIDSKSEGRFIASFPIFIDPEVYKPGQYLTIAGTIEGEIKRPIGEFDYTFPVVNVSASNLWQIGVWRGPYDPPPPWWYYDPWWPYYPGPYYHRYYSPYLW